MNIVSYHLKLITKPHSSPYKVAWINNTLILVSKLDSIASGTRAKGSYVLLVSSTITKPKP